MSFGSALLSGDECYSKGQFDDAIKYYTEAANQGYVEGMEKLLKTSVEQGRACRDTLDEKAIAYWSLASKTLKVIMEHGEISKEVKDRSYTYYEEIMHGLAHAFIWGSNHAAALNALNKLSAKGNVMIEAQKAYCELHICIQAGEQAVEELKQNASSEEEKDKIFPVTDNPRVIECFEHFTILDKLTEKECKKLVQKSSRGDVLIFSMILYQLIIIWFTGVSNGLQLVERDGKKAYAYWKLRKIVDPDPAAEIPQSFKDFFEEFKEVLEDPTVDLKSESSSSKSQPKPAPQPKPTPAAPTTRTITVTRKANLLCGIAVSVKIFVDGTLKGQVKNGESIQIDVDTGAHKVEAKMGLNHSNIANIPADSMDYRLEYVFQAGMWANSHELSITGKKPHGTGGDYTVVTKIEDMEGRVKWMTHSQEIEDFVWFIEQLFTPKMMHKVGQESLVEKYDKVSISSVNYKEIIFCGRNQERIMNIPVPYKDNKFELKNADETKYLEHLIHERLKSLPHIGVKGIHYFLIE